MKSSNIGGQAVMEGMMMKNGDTTPWPSESRIRRLRSK